MFIPCKETILEMSPRDFEKHAINILTSQIKNIDNYNFQHDKIIEVDDGNYQIDGFIEFELMGVSYKTLVECKHYKSSISREKIAVLYDKIRACGANKGILVSSSNFQRGAIQYASKHGIALIQLTDTGSTYEVRSSFSTKNNAFKPFQNVHYTGIMQIDDNQTIRCLHLSNTVLAVRDFLLIDRSDKMRKALCVGIDSYQSASDLYGCVNDANAVKAVLERNGDGTLNFDIKLMCSTSEDSYITRTALKDAITELFSSESEIAILYYAGHGAYDALGGYLCTSEVQRGDEGLSLDDIMGIVSESKAQNKVVILDSCHSGFAATSKQMPNYSILHNGTTILAGCDEKQYSSEENGQGVFTSLLIEALYGGAMNLLGEVSPGSIYSYIDRSLGGWEQRPIFKANIKGFISLRRNSPPIAISDLRRITEIFNTPYEEYPLDPTYEPDKHEADIKEVNKEHEEIFAILQKYVKLNLVVPVNAEHMYYAAINHKSCKLTVQGQHYWNLAKKNTI